MTEMILAIDQRGGLGLNGKIPWKCRDDLMIFSQKTMGNTLLVGRFTLENLPFLGGRNFICLTTHPKNNIPASIQMGVNSASTKIANSIEEALDLINKRSTNQTRVDSGKSKLCHLMVIGGLNVYKSALMVPGLIKRVHISILDREYQCDTYFDIRLLKHFSISESERYNDFTHYVLTSQTSWEVQYMDLIEKILREGEIRLGRNGETKSIFKYDLKIDLRQGFPLVSTRKMFFRGIVEELLFFLRGETDSTVLEKAGINIWKLNTRRQFLDSLGLSYPEGTMGPMYGYQWRSFGSPYEDLKKKERKKGIDQLKELIELIHKDPMSRRLLLTTYNPSQAKEGVLFPCHSIVNQFYVSSDPISEEDHIDMYVYNRSSDVFLGLPFNIASSALLLSIVAKLTDKIPRFLYLATGDTHIYGCHLSQADLQLKRLVWSPPQVELPNLSKNIEDLHTLRSSDFKLVNYQYHPAIKVDMVA